MKVARSQLEAPRKTRRTIDIQPPFRWAVCRTFAGIGGELATVTAN
jgi:hypothetical protein